MEATTLPPWDAAAGTGGGLSSQSHSVPGPDSIVSHAWLIGTGKGRGSVQRAGAHTRRAQAVHGGERGDGMGRDGTLGGFRERAGLGGRTGTRGVLEGHTRPRGLQSGHDQNGAAHLLVQWVLVAGVALVRHLTDGTEMQGTETEVLVAGDEQREGLSRIYFWYAILIC